ncbi:MAG: hypothetical protein ABSE72_03165 [Bacteroidales bacterium]|jgi:hypothetical protein
MSTGIQSMKANDRTPKEIMNDILVQNFKNNVYFKFSDFVQNVKSVQSKKKIDYEMMQDFINEMIDIKKVEQIYVEENKNPFLSEKEKTSEVKKSIHFKIVVAI